MTSPPPRPCIYHITHVSNLPAIVASGGLLSDRAMRSRGGPTADIGMDTIKLRRMRLPVTCHPGDQVGDYVPFYFCPRSIMLYVIYCKNHPSLTYRGGQEPIVHLEADLHAVVDWASRAERRWAFSLTNAGAAYTEFRSSLDRLVDVDWSAVTSIDFRSQQVRAGKQAEFLVHEDFPWHLIRRIGAASLDVAQQARAAISTTTHQPPILVRKE